MVTGDIRNRIDQIWNAFWAGGIANPLEVIEQITYLLFIRRLDDLQTLEENKANRLKQPIQRRIFPEGRDGKGRAYEDYRWSRFQHFAPADMFEVVGEHIFPYLRTGLAQQLGNGESTYAHHMKDARFTIPTPALLAKVVDMLAHVPMEDRDTNGDIYEYMLAKIASAGQNGQFRTPRHIIRLMVELTAPQPTDVICDPACGTAGFLVAAGEYLRDQYPNLLHDKKRNEHSLARSRSTAGRLGRRIALPRAHTRVEGGGAIRKLQAPHAGSEGCGCGPSGFGWCPILVKQELGSDRKKTPPAHTQKEDWASERETSQGDSADAPRSSRVV